MVFVAIGNPANLWSQAFPYGADQVGHNWWLVEFAKRVQGGHLPLGWTAAHSDGAAFGYFYFPLPALVCALLQLVLPTAVSIKVTLLMAVLLVPFGAVQLLAGLGCSRRFQVVAMVSTLAMLLSAQFVTGGSGFSIAGGNIFSTFVGEFSYSFALGLGCWWAGEVARICRGSGRWWLAGVLTAATALSHAQAFFVMAILVAVICAFNARDGRTAKRLLGAGALGAVLSAWWWLPTLSMYGEAMGDGKALVNDLWKWVFAPPMLAIAIIGFVGLGWGAIRNLTGARVLATAAALTLGAVALPVQMFGTGRSVPLGTLLLSIGIAYLLEALFQVWFVPLPKRVLGTSGGIGVIAVLLAFVLACGAAFVAPESRGRQREVNRRAMTGISAVPAANSVRALINKLNELPPGQAIVETPRNSDETTEIDAWYTELPRWTNGRITTPVSLYAEGSISAPTIEYLYSNLSAKPHKSTSWTPSPAGMDVSLGLKQAQTYGVTYYITSSSSSAETARSAPGVTEVATVGDAPAKFTIFSMDAPLVVSGKTFERVGAMSKQAWVLDGIKYLKALKTDPNTAIPVVKLPEKYAAATPAVAISNITRSDTRIGFTAAQTEVPILVRASYSKRWQVTGAKGPYRAAPNVMVVIPTQQNVAMRFTPPATQPIGWWITVAGLVFLLGLALTAIVRRGQRRMGGHRSPDTPTSESKVTSDAATDDDAPDDATPDETTRAEAPLSDDFTPSGVASSSARPRSRSLRKRRH